MALVLLLGPPLTGCLSLASTSNGTPARQDAPSDPSGDAPFQDWASVDEATVRPGIRIDTDEDPAGECTTSAVYRSSTNGSVYLSTAGHCVPAENEAASGPVTVLGSNGARHHTQVVASNLTEDGVDGIDYALLRVPDRVRTEVNPRVLAVGGPTGVADPSDGDRVVFYGNSTDRPGSPAVPNTAHGVVTGRTERGNVVVNMAPLGIPGDSGGPFVTPDGAFVGLLSSEGVQPVGAGDPCLGCAVVMSHQNIVEQAAKAGYDVTLATTPTAS